MKIISHRGNLNGPSDLENNPGQLLRVVGMGLDVEIDLWGIDNQFWLGHDKPQYLVDEEFICSLSNVAWYHCKNLEAVRLIKKITNCFEPYPYTINFFWHESDKYAITSRGYVWAYPGMPLDKNSINVLPELSGINSDECYAVCTDYPLRYVTI